MRSIAFAALLFALSAVAAPVADADAALEKREPHVAVADRHVHVDCETTTVKRQHTSYVTPAPPSHHHKSGPSSDDDSKPKGKSGKKGSKGEDEDKNSKKGSRKGSKASDDSSPYSSSSYAPDQDSQSMLDAHNKFRSKHGVSEYSWSDELASFAFDHASTCVFEHTGGKFGENLAAGFPGIEESINGWYDEIDEYDFNNPGFSERTGHFTQVVWKGSGSVGCAWVSCNTKDTPGMYLVCEYEGAGNVIGAFEENVFPSE
jgi:uncharacterized protein YkwD